MECSIPPLSQGDPKHAPRTVICLVSESVRYLNTTRTVEKAGERPRHRPESELPRRESENKSENKSENLHKRNLPPTRHTAEPDRLDNNRTHAGARRRQHRWHAARRNDGRNR